jgi:hypothetical protein
VTTHEELATLLLLQPSRDLSAITAAALVQPAAEAAQVSGVRPLHEALLLPAARAHAGAASLLCCALRQRGQAAAAPALLALQQPEGGRLTAVLQPLQLRGGFEGQAEGVAHLLCPATSQTIMVGAPPLPPAPLQPAPTPPQLPAPASALRVLQRR